MSNSYSNPLKEYFYNNNKKLMYKWDHYFDIYHRHFDKYRNKKIVVLEIGVSQGGSLQMWKDYFGKDAVIYGVDINPNCKALEEENIHVRIGSQEDREFLRSLKNEMPPIDILIDDGGHSMKQQIVTFEELFDHIKPNGVYLCEDTHSSYWSAFGGGYQKKTSYIEYVKNLIDDLNAWHSTDKKLQPSNFTKTSNSMHFYDSVVLIEKNHHPKPEHIWTGTPQVEKWAPPKTMSQKIKSKVGGLFYKSGLKKQVSDKWKKDDIPKVNDSTKEVTKIK